MIDMAHTEGDTAQPESWHRHRNVYILEENVSPDVMLASTLLLYLLLVQVQQMSH